MNKIRETLHQVLKIVDIPREKRAEVIDGIVQLIDEYTLIIMLQRLDKDTQLEFKRIIRTKENKQEFILSFIEKYYTTDAIKRIIEEQTTALICDYIRSISPMMSQKQKEDVKALLGDCYESNDSDLSS